MVQSPHLFAEPLTLDKIAHVRQHDADSHPSNTVLECQGRYRIHEQLAPGVSSDPDVPMLVCERTSSPVPTPVMYFIHGGGMIVGTRRSELDVMIALADQAGAALVSVEYRLAPEHPDPAPINDCWAGLHWLVDNAHEFNIDPGRIVLYGASAGGGLAAGLALMCRDRQGPELIGQMLVCPMLDEGNDSTSAIQFSGRGAWYRETNEMAWSALLGDRRRTASVSHYASPAYAQDLADLPPAFIDVGSAEVFRDEAVAYASRLWASGGRAELHVWPGGFHGYDFVAPSASISRATVHARVDWLHRLLSQF
ncbi:alpha/beta hydrolase [Aeromicrobium wangtongii]|uniref:Alpha/beta hydrolase n=1 Tax=Aeromicrobium wangtongii TaxID=2969247 RepID=A0ABY5MEP5_9ACTN|nr:alpha/beta hydrolase [Aeromicrobium wangtongii]UUP15389.1 alpha/beta hydrolase [Aeromicrobium wangtongii]